MKPTFEGWGESARAIVLVFLLVAMAFVSVISMTENARGESLVIVSDSSDGYNTHTGASYPPYTTYSHNEAYDHINVGQSYVVGTYAINRGFLSFDTSAVPSSATIVSATLSLQVNQFSVDTNFDVYVWACPYGTFDVNDWNTTGSFQGSLLNSASLVRFSWYSLNLADTAVNRSGFTQLMLNSSRDGNAAPTAYEFVWFGSYEYSGQPTLTISYMEAGVPISMELDSGDWLNTTALADVSDWNITYEIWCFEMDTVPNTKNVTVSKQASSWTLCGLVPACNYTESDTDVLLWDVYDSICYRVWFYVPKVNPYTTVHLALYNSFTGEGFFWEQMKVMICDGLTWDETSAEELARADFEVEPSQNYTIRVLDYFDNALVDYPFVANSANIYLSIPVPYYSWQVFNMNEMPILMKIYWNNSGAPWEFFVGPQWIIERNLKGGNYTFMCTFYNSDGTAGETVSYSRVVPMTGLNASFIMVNGTTLTEIITDIEGLQATQEIITSLVSPSKILVYENLPLAPVHIQSMSIGESIEIDPYLVLEATTYQNDSGTDMELWVPHPDTTGATYYILSDVLTFSGDYSTDVWVNDTEDSSNLYNSTSLPATVLLSGENVTVEASTDIAVSRATTWREVTEYTVTYYNSSKKYQVTLSLNNTSPFDYYEPYWFIGFPTDSVIALDSVTVYDLDNSLTLSQTAHFEVTSGGIHMTLAQLNASDVRNFRITYYDYNSTDWIGAPNLVAYSYTTASYDGTPMKFTAVQWGNPWSIEYRGEVYITLNFTYGDALKESSIKIVDQSTNRVLTDSEFVYTGRTIIILTTGVGTVPVGGGVNFGIYWTFDATQAEDKHDFFFDAIIWNGQMFYLGGFPVSIAVLVICCAWFFVAMVIWKDRKDAFALGVIVAALTIIVFVFGAQVT